MPEDNASDSLRHFVRMVDPPEIPVSEIIPHIGTQVQKYMEGFRDVKSVPELLALNETTLGEKYAGVDKFTAGTVFGYCSGCAVKRVFRAVTFMAGLGFITMQAINYGGYVDVNWAKISQQLSDRLDLNHDGVLDQQDLNLARKKLMRMLLFGLPSGAGFGTGFLMAMRS